MIREGDMLHFTSLTVVAVFQAFCGCCADVTTTTVWWYILGYRKNRTETSVNHLTRAIIALLVSLVFNYLAVIVSVILLIVKATASSRRELKKAMSSYSFNLIQKRLMDRLQIAFRCCGCNSHADWFQVDWQGTDLEPEMNDSFFDWASVPFSCCSIEVPPPCAHEQLQMLGSHSLHREGCAAVLDRAVVLFVVTSLVLFVISVASMSYLLLAVRKVETSARSALDKGDASAAGEWHFLSPSKTSRDSADRQPLLEKEPQEIRKQSSSELTFFGSKNQRLYPVLQMQKPKPKSKRPQTRKWETYEVDSCPEVDSSEEWPTMINNDTPSQVTSATSLMTTTLYEDSRLSDIAVASLDVSEHSEHTFRPLYRT